MKLKQKYTDGKTSSGMMLTTSFTKIRKMVKTLLGDRKIRTYVNDDKVNRSSLMCKTDSIGEPFNSMGSFCRKMLITNDPNCL
jgi:hypothetical protein